MDDKKYPEWEKLSQTEREQLKDLGITDKKDYNVFLRTLGTMSTEDQENKSMGVVPKPKPKLPSIKSPPKEVSASKGKAITKKKKAKAKPNAIAVTLVIPTGKAKMANGGMANNKSHMYSCGGMVHDKRKKK